MIVKKTIGVRSTRTKRGHGVTTTHGMSHSPEWVCWKAMVARSAEKTLTTPLAPNAKKAGAK